MNRILMTGIAILMAASVAMAETPAKATTPAQKKLEQQLKETVLPECDFRQANLADVIDFLRVQARAQKKDINIIMIPAVTDDAPTITLTFKNVALGEVIRYVTEITGSDYRIDDNAVVITGKAGSHSYVTEATIQPISQAEKQYLVTCKITDKCHNQDLSAPKLTVKAGQQAEIKQCNDNESSGIFCTALVNEKDNGIECVIKVVIKENGKEAINHTQILTLKK
jgi:type II secretory pathway component GspD/PulD (secretin)